MQTYSLLERIGYVIEMGIGGEGNIPNQITATRIGAVTFDGKHWEVVLEPGFIVSGISPTQRITSVQIKGDKVTFSCLSDNGEVVTLRGSVLQVHSGT